MVIIGRMAALAVMTAAGALIRTAAVPARPVTVRFTDTDTNRAGDDTPLGTATKGEIDRELWKAEFDDAFATPEAKRTRTNEIEARFVAMGHDPDAVREHISHALMEIAAEKSW